MNRHGDFASAVNADAGDRGAAAQCRLSSPLHAHARTRPQTVSNPGRLRGEERRPGSSLARTDMRLRPFRRPDRRSQRA